MDLIEIILKDKVIIYHDTEIDQATIFLIITKLRFYIFIVQFYIIHMLFRIVGIIILIWFHF